MSQIFILDTQISHMKFLPIFDLYLAISYRYMYKTKFDIATLRRYILYSEEQRDELDWLIKEDKRGIRS